jgi:hypothetical protein
MKMGLDMYASTLLQAPPSDVDFDRDDAIEIHYWRMHPNLHGWMESLTRKAERPTAQLRERPIHRARPRLSWNRAFTPAHCR